MPIIETENNALRSLSGVHLWHANMSSCSQRVRITLAEKNVPFTSHLIDLHAGENAGLEYQAIHPEGLVPAMVIDGELIIESIDIIDELGKRYGGQSLRPSTSNDTATMTKIMERAGNAQAFLKVLTYEFLFSAAPPVSKEIFDAYQKTHKNESLKQFQRDFAAGFSRERIHQAVEKCHEDFVFLDNHLSDGRSYFLGDQFSLADIAWIPNFHRFELFEWPFESYKYLNAWFERVKARPSYKTGLVDWEPEGFKELVSPNITKRRNMGDGVDAYIPR